VFAAVLGAVVLGVPGSGCLNPLPEEWPSQPESVPNSRPTPQRETCEDNPLLAECELPEADIAGKPADDPPPTEGSSGFGNDEAEQSPGAVDVNEAGEGDAGGGDAGPGPIDAGAP
jgi:hypothetical protein